MGGYNSDMQETKFSIISGIESTKASLLAMTTIVSKLKFNKEKIEKELDDGFSQATEIADYLAMNGVSFRDAHEQSGKMVEYCEENNLTVSQIDHIMASKLLKIKIPEKIWNELKGFKRERLECKIVPKNSKAKIEKSRIKKVYEKLLS